jgi:predicted hydrocarbon binding protein
MANSTMIGIALPTLRDLRSRVLASSSSDDAVDALREAGYSGGESVYEAFEQWLREADENADVNEMQISEFGTKMTQFFRDAGWGEIDFSQDDDDDVAKVTVNNCWEAELGDGCHIYTGVLASFFGRVAGYPIAVLETVCSPDGHCEFLIGNSDVMNQRWKQLTA